MSRKKLGEMLIEAGVLDEAGLRAALADQRRWGRSLGRTLVEMKIVDEEVMVEVLGHQLKLDSVDLDKIEIAKDILALIPADIARSAKVIPFATQMKFLHVAMSDPTNLGLLDELRIRTQLNIRPFLCGPRQLERAIDHYYGDGVRSDSIPFDPPDTFEATVPQGHRRPAAVTSTDPRPARAPIGGEGLRPFPRTIAPPLATAPLAEQREAEIEALQIRISKLEALVARDEEVLRKVLALLIDKGIATRDEIVERLS